ncbi:MAG TPA: divalent-cation tolerance protein CutA [Candidatus Acidoferrum sp.]|nr:divalent-cation tolerance protein CutA [Candidatus Acidoferrum sp.]
MKVAGKYRAVLVTCGTLMEARRISRSVVGKRLAACVNIILSPAESFYTWKGELEKAREYLLVMKTSAKRLAELEKEVKRLHSYDVPEFVALPITEGSTKYLSWLEDSVTKIRKKPD